MTKRRNKASMERIREVVSYDPVTGIFRWLVAPRYGINPGDVAGVESNGYLRIGIDGTLYCGHRLAWMFVIRTWPKHNIDHKNGLRSDNRFINLRDVSQRVNIENQQKPRSDNSSGYLGVSWDRNRGKWKAAIRSYGRTLHLGRFDTPEQGHAVYVEAKRKLHEGNML